MWAISASCSPSKSGPCDTIGRHLPKSNEPMRWYCCMAMLLSMNPYKLFVHPLLHQRGALAIPSVVCLLGSNEPMRWYHRMAMLLSMNPYELFVHPLLHQQATLAIASAVCLPGSNETMRWYRRMAMLLSMNPIRTIRASPVVPISGPRDSIGSFPARI